MNVNILRILRVLFLIFDNYSEHFSERNISVFGFGLSNQKIAETEKYYIWIYYTNIYLSYTFIWHPLLADNVTRYNILNIVLDNY